MNGSAWFNVRAAAIQSRFILCFFIPDPDPFARYRQTAGCTQAPYSSVAMMARKVAMPQPFSLDVTTISGKAAGCLANPVRT